MTSNNKWWLLSIKHTNAHATQQENEILYTCESVSDMTPADSKGILYIYLCISLSGGMALTNLLNIMHSLDSVVKAGTSQANSPMTLVRAKYQ